MTDNEIIKALERCGQHRECCYCNSVEECGSKRVLVDNCLDLINRQKAEIERFKNRQKPTATSGYKLENGKVVFFTNMLGGCRIEKENLEEVVKTLNELLQECYNKDEIVFALKCKTEELQTAKAEIERLKGWQDLLKAEKHSLIKAEAVKEFAEKLHEELRMYGIKDKFNKSVFLNVVDKAKKETVGDA